MRSVAGLFALALVALLNCSSAAADIFEQISLASQSGGPQVPTAQRAQAQYAHDPAVSGNGRYVAFDGYFAGSTGVFRRDLSTGVVQLVAGGDAELPSISDSGRYVAFTTTAQLSANDGNASPDVYVRDMEAGAGETEYTLASAVDGGVTALAYEGEPGFGSVASPRSALSADGRHVVFVTTAVSDLDGAGTPPFQVAVRDLDTLETQLVSARYDPATGHPAVDPETGRGEPVSSSEGGILYGAVYVPGGSAPVFPYRGDNGGYKMAPPLGASISADGTTVTWLGQNIPAQAPVLSGEALFDRYAEPLWRRVGDGAAAPTRRVTGGGDPANPACAASGETHATGALSDPCQGPFVPPPDGTWSGAAGDVVPQLSADGQTVVFLSAAGLLARGADFGVGREVPSDLYLVDMREGLTRSGAIRPLTEFTGSGANAIRENGPIMDLAISPDGSQVAFTSLRAVFPLGSPGYVSELTALPGMLELFSADLTNDTLTRVTHGFEGGPSEAPHQPVPAGLDPYGEGSTEVGALAPSFSDNGHTLAFSSTASNLAYGDGNTPPNQESTVFDGSDAFVVNRELFGVTPTAQYISSPPAVAGLNAPWKLGVTAVARGDGTVALTAAVPGAGSLRAGAQSTVRVRASGAHAARGAGQPRRSHWTVASRTVASRTARPGQAELVTLVLKLGGRYRSLAARRGGLSATATLVFSAAGHHALHDSIAITFLRRGHAQHRVAKVTVKGQRSPRSSVR